MRPAAETPAERIARVAVRAGDECDGWSFQVDGRVAESDDGAPVVIGGRLIEVCRSGVFRPRRGPRTGAVCRG